MNDDFVSLFTFNRWANARMLDACRKLTPEQYAAEPVPDRLSRNSAPCLNLIGHHTGEYPAESPLSCRLSQPR